MAERDSDTFASLVSSIRASRRGRVRETLTEAQRIDAAWEETLARMTALRDEIGQHPVLRAFSISARTRSILITLAAEDGTAKHATYVRVSRVPANGVNFPGFERIWLAVSDNPREQQFENAEAVMREVTILLASRLA